jgi:CRP-like cAMP-binding protein
MIIGCAKSSAPLRNLAWLWPVSAPSEITPCSQQGFDDQCLGCVASHLRQVVFGGGEVVYERGERGDEMYLILDGSVVLHTRLTPPCFDLQAQQQHAANRADEDRDGDSVVANTAAKGERFAGKGDVFGEAGLFPGELGSCRRECVTTLSRMTAYVMNAAALQEIADEYPEVLLCIVRV